MKTTCLACELNRECSKSEEAVQGPDLERYNFKGDYSIKIALFPFVA